MSEILKSAKEWLAEPEPDNGTVGELLVDEVTALIAGLVDEVERLARLNNNLLSDFGGYMEKGQSAYEHDLMRRPTYHDGTPRKPWELLSKVAKQSWEYGYVDLEVKCGTCGEITVHHMTPSEADRTTGASCGHCGRSGQFSR